MQTGPLLDEAYVATGKVVHVFRHFPLPQLGHTNAIPAAKASYCAGQQAPKLFWGLHDWLFSNQAAWSTAQDAAAQFRKQAVALGADGAKYDACLTNAATEARINRDLQEGSQMGIQGTPSFFVNDWSFSGAYPFEEFQKTIEKALAGQKPPPTPTPLPAGVNFYDPDPNRPGLTYDGSPTLGDAKANLMMLAFADFKSAPSAQYAKTVWPALREKYVDAGKMRVVFKVFPTGAPKAAAAAACAASQGKFWEFQDLLFSKQAEWKDGDAAAMSGYAKSLGLDAARFTQCLSDPATQYQVDAALKFGEEVGVPDTPAFLFIDLKQQTAVSNIVGAKSLAEFESAIQAALGGQSAAPTNRPTPISAAKLASLPVGVDTNGNFYRGDPKAPIQLVDFSDFQ